MMMARDSVLVEGMPFSLSRSYSRLSLSGPGSPHRGRSLPEAGQASGPTQTDDSSVWTIRPTIVQSVAQERDSGKSFRSGVTFSPGRTRVRPEITMVSLPSSPLRTIR